MLKDFKRLDIASRIDRDLNAIAVENLLSLARWNKGIFVRAVFKEKKSKAFVILIDRGL
jgi:hypothetical protein